MDWTRRGLLAAGGLSVVAPTTAWAGPDREPLWEIRDGAARVFLFGEGFSAPDKPWASARVEAALSQSAVLWKETPEPAPGDNAVLLKQAVDPKAPLSSWLTAKQRERLATGAAAAGVSLSRLEPFRPWAAAILLSSGSTKHSGLKSAGKDSHSTLTAQAKAAGKPLRAEFPDAAALVAFFSGLSKAAQVQYLLMQAEGYEEGPEVAARRSRAWAAGDLGVEEAQLRRLARANPEAYLEVIVARNCRWPGRVRAMLDSGETSFVMIGSDHLFGLEGVLNMLSAAGMPTRRI